MGRPPTDPSTHALTTQRQRVKVIDDVHRHLALLVALGFSNKAIAEELQVNSNRISVIKNSPAVRDLIETYRQSITEKALIESIIRRLSQEFDPSIDVITKLRDDETAEQTIQLAAAKFLVEKATDVIVPKKTINEEHKKVGVVVLNADDLAALNKIATEDDAFEADFTEVDEGGTNDQSKGS